jgi:hypothetical protein
MERQICPSSERTIKTLEKKYAFMKKIMKNLLVSQKNYSLKAEFITL